VSRWSRDSPSASVAQWLQKRSKFTARYWDFDTPIEITQTVTDKDWEQQLRASADNVALPASDKDWDELRYCRYLRPGLPRFLAKDKQHDSSAGCE